MNTFPIRLLTPDHTVFSGPVEACNVRAVDGELGILAGHMPLLAPIPPGVIRLVRGAETLRFVSGEAMLSIPGDGSVTVLSEYILKVRDSAEARERMDRYHRWEKDARALAEKP